jgi:biotin transport system substrate-specific component
MVEAIAQVLPRLRAARLKAFTWRCALPVAGKVALAFGMAALTGIAAQVRIPLGFTPVPITGQVFAVLLAGVLMGRFYGGLSQVMYVGLGVAGLPWFAGLSGGLGAIAGPSGGYLIGFVVAAELIGRVSDRWVEARHFVPQFALMLAAVAVIHLCGVVQLAVWLGGHLKQALVMGTLPFLAVDAAKTVLAASISTALLPKGRADESDAG